MPSLEEIEAIRAHYATTNNCAATARAFGCSRNKVRYWTADESYRQGKRDYLSAYGKRHRRQYKINLPISTANPILQQLFRIAAKRCLTEQALAKLCGISAFTLSRWRRGEVDAKSYLVSVLAEALGAKIIVVEGADQPFQHSDGPAPSSENTS